MAQIDWTLDHQEDLDADFLAIYGIDLYEQEVDGPRYFALSHRLAAYQGVMAARVEEVREERRPASSTPTRTSTEAAPAQRGDSEVHEVSLTQFRAKFPGLVSVGGSAGGG
ncbi:hypothetical protein [Streptomyces spinosirectus]